MYVQRKSLVSAVCACTVFLSFACGVLLDCKRTSLTASAEAVDPYDLILLFKSEMEENLVETEEAILQDIQNGTLDYTSALAKERLAGLAALYVSTSSPAFVPAFKAADLISQGLESDYFDQNPTITVSVSGGTGFYRKSSGGQLYIATVNSCKAGEVVCSSDDFNLIIDFNDATMNSNTVPYSENRRAGFKYTGSTIYHQVRYTDTKGYLAYIGQSYNVFQNNVYAIDWGSSSPEIVTPGMRADYLYLAQGSYIDFPTTTIDSSVPWQFYNNVVLPKIHEDYPDLVMPFPDGWIPPVLPTDTREPTSPTGDFILPPYGELMTEPSSWFVTDESGETITDESGEPVTETTMIPVTVASSEEGRYVFRIPTLPNLEVPETPELSLSLPQKLVGLSAALFRGVYEILDSSGVLTILPFLVAVAIAIYVIYHIGG